VVWFSDPLQPYVRLLHQLLAGRPAIEWYWRSLFNGVVPRLDSKGVSRLLLASQQTPLKTLAVAHLVATCVESRHTAHLLPLISPQLARQLLHDSGVTPVVVTASALAYKAAGNAGAGRDTTTPRSGHSLPPRLSGAWLETLCDAASAWGDADVRSQWLAHQALVFHHPAYAEHSDSLQKIGRWLPLWLAQAQGHFSVAQAPRHLPAGSLEQPSESPEPDAQRSPQVQEQEPGDGSSAKSFDQRWADALGIETSASKGFTEAPGRVVSEPKTPIPDESAAPASQAERTRALLGAWSPCAGLGLLLPLMQRLGMAQLMSENEDLIRCQFHLQLLRDIARRCGMECDDPMTALFESFEEVGLIADCKVSLPVSWQRHLELLPARFDLPQQVSAHGLVFVMQLMMRRYFRWHCGISLREVVCRPGRLVLTHTHLDVIFDIEQVDLRLRRAALDSDPGWVPWLGRVVQFHYDTTGHRYV
jgi:hypothetical protein